MRLSLLIIATIASATPALAETCPPAPDLEPRKSELMSAVRSAETELDAKLLTNEMWALWTKAPDSTAQDWLDTGIERRAAYDFDGAIKAFDALVDYCPHYAEGYNQRAFVNFIRQDYQTSLTDLDRALELSPDHYAALTGKAMALYVLGDQPAAFKELRRALDMNPWLPERHMLPADMQPQSGKEL